MLLSSVAPPSLRHKAATDNMLQIIKAQPNWPVYADVFERPPPQLASRCPIWSDMTSVNTITQRPFFRYQKVQTNLDFTEARDSEWHWHQLGHMQVCTLLQTDNHTRTPPLSFLQAGCPSYHPTNSVKAL